MRRDERGSALVELSWLGILLVLPMLWIVMSVFEVQRGAFGVSAAARAGRTGLCPGAGRRVRAWSGPGQRPGSRSTTRACTA